MSRSGRLSLMNVLHRLDGQIVCPFSSFFVEKHANPLLRFLGYFLQVTPGYFSHDTKNVSCAWRILNECKNRGCVFSLLDNHKSVSYKMRTIGIHWFHSEEH